MRSTNGVNFTQISTNLQATTFFDTGLTDGTQYTYTVTAFNSAGTSQPSNAVTVMPMQSHLTQAQVIQMATTFCQSIGQPSINTPTAIYPAPLPRAPGSTGYYTPCWQVSLGSPVSAVVNVADATGVVTYYYNYDLEAQYSNDTSAPATPVGDSSAVSIATSVLNATGLDQSQLAAPTDQLAQIYSPATNGGQEYIVSWRRQSGSYLVEDQFARVLLQADTGAVLAVNVSFTTPPVVSAPPIVTSAQARTTSDNQLASFASNFGSYSYYAQWQQLVRPNNFWTTFDQTPLAGTTPRLSWITQYGTLNPDGVLNVFVDASSGQIIGASYAMVARGDLVKLKKLYDLKAARAKRPSKKITATLQVHHLPTQNKRAKHK